MSLLGLPDHQALAREWSFAAHSGAGLPDRIRCVRFAPMNQFESVAVGFRSFMRKG
jgi:hypothetical protein